MRVNGEKKCARGTCTWEGCETCTGRYKRARGKACMPDMRSRGGSGHTRSCSSPRLQCAGWRGYKAASAGHVNHCGWMDQGTTGPVRAVVFTEQLKCIKVGFSLPQIFCLRHVFPEEEWGRRSKKGCKCTTIGIGGC